MISKEDRIRIINLMEQWKQFIPPKHIHWYWKTIRYINDMSAK